MRGSIDQRIPEILHRWCRSYRDGEIFFSTVRAMTHDHDDEVTQNAPADPFSPLSLPVLSLIFKQHACRISRKPAYVSRREFEDASRRKARQFYTRRAFADDVCVRVYKFSP